MSEFDRLHQGEEGAYKNYEAAEYAHIHAKQLVLTLLEERLILEGLFAPGVNNTSRVDDYRISDDGKTIRIYTQTWWHSWEDSGYEELPMDVVRMSYEEHAAAIVERKRREKEEKILKEETAKKVAEEKEYQKYLELQRKYG